MRVQQPQLVGSIIWAAAWTLLVVGLVLDSNRIIGCSLFAASLAATATSWVISKVVAGQVALAVVSEERLRVEEMAKAVASVLVQEYKLGRFPPE